MGPLGFISFNEERFIARFSAAPQTHCPPETANQICEVFFEIAIDERILWSLFLVGSQPSSFDECF
jgi:hypothetical protein